MSARPWVLAESPWKTVKDQGYDLALLPWGAIEPHNYHLPFATDALQAEAVAVQSAALAWKQGARPIVLPTVPWGVNTGQTDLKLCLNILPSTQLILLNDLVQNLVNHGIEKLVIINSHGGNDFIPLIRELSVKQPKMFLCCLDWWKVCPAGGYFDEPGDHAGELETSVLLALHPEWVLPLDQAGDGKPRKFAIEALRQRWVWAQRRWTEVSESTGIGDPRLATREKGQAFLDACVEKTSGFLIELSRTPLSELYQD